MRVQVTIDGTEYVAVTAKRITVDGVVYAALQGPPYPEPGKPVKIIDNDDDVWVPSSRDGYYRCTSTLQLPQHTRESIEQYWGITREEF